MFSWGSTYVVDDLGHPMTHNTHVAAMDRLIDRVERLHSAPHVVCQVLQLLQDEDYQVHELVGCLQADPALASSILRLVNSSYFGLARHVGSLQQAVSFLGSRSLRLAVLSFGLLKQLAKDTPALVYQDFWRRSLTMASVGSRLATRQRRTTSGEAYSAGLLADIGMLLLAQVETRGYVKLYEQVGHSHCCCESERERYGFHHGQLGARLLHRWNLPLPLTEAVCGAPHVSGDGSLLGHDHTHRQPDGRRVVDTGIATRERGPDTRSNRNSSSTWTDSSRWPSNARRRFKRTPRPFRWRWPTRSIAMHCSLRPTANTWKPPWKPPSTGIASRQSSMATTRTEEGQRGRRVEGQRGRGAEDEWTGLTGCTGFVTAQRLDPRTHA